MVVKQLLKDIQKLIDRGTINPSAEISIEGYIEVFNGTDDYAQDFEATNLTVEVHESSYNKLILSIKED